MNEVTAILPTAKVLPFGREVDASDAEIVVGRTGEFQVTVPAMGVLLVGQIAQPQSEPIVRMAPPEWHGLLIQLDAAGNYSSESNHVRRSVTEADDGTLRIELIPCSSGEDRLVVVIDRGENGSKREATDG